MQTFIDGVSEAVRTRKDLTLDPVAAIISILILIIYAGLRLTGHRKSRRQLIAEMEDADFPDGIDPVTGNEIPRDRSP